MYSSSVKDIASLINGIVDGNPNQKINGVCNINEGKVNCITFLSSAKYKKYFKTTSASAIIIKKDLDIINNGKTVIKVNNPKLAFAKVLENFGKKEQIIYNIHKSVVIGKNCDINNNISIGPNVTIGNNVNIKRNSIIGSGTYIGNDVLIKNNCVIKHNVTICDDSIVGNNVTIDSGTVIGADGFGWTTLNNTHYKIPQIGNVIIDDDVWIGANCCIDRATFDSTIIGKGTKMDNLIQIAHNVKVGKYCLIAGGVAIAGSSKIGDWVTIAGQVGIIDHLVIGSKTIIASKSAVYKSVPEGSFISGIPARHHPDRLRQDIAISKLPDLQKKIRSMESKIKDIKE